MCHIANCTCITIFGFAIVSTEWHEIVNTQLRSCRPDTFFENIIGLYCIFKSFNSVESFHEDCVWTLITWERQPVAIHSVYTDNKIWKSWILVHARWIKAAEIFGRLKWHGFRCVNPSFSLQSDVSRPCVPVNWMITTYEHNRMTDEFYKRLRPGSPTTVKS